MRLDAPQAPQTVLVIGRESVGKSQLVSSLTGCSAGEANFRGSTVSVHRYCTRDRIYIDTPGILRQSDTETTRAALEALSQQEEVLLVVQATQLDEDLSEMLPLVHGKRGAVVVTYWDKVQLGEAAFEAIERLSADAGVPFVTVDSRRLLASQSEAIQEALQAGRDFQKGALTVRAGWRIEPRPGLLEHAVIGPVLAVGLLLLPLVATIFGANRLADLLHPLVTGWIAPAKAAINATWPAWTQVLLTAESHTFAYGLLNMGPFLLVWALPTVLLFSVLLGIYKSTGLIERINVALHPWVRPLGLSGRDVIRILMGFGCNVPAVVSTRACSRCSRGPAMAAIAFGAACSYQLPATLAVLAAAGQETGQSGMRLTAAYMGYLFITTVIYLRLTAPADASSQLNLLLAPRRPFMQWPTVKSVWSEARQTVVQFLTRAMPIFVVICLVTSVLATTGLITLISAPLEPVMQLFHLPRDASLPIFLSILRKDAIFLLSPESGLLGGMTAAQALNAVYLAGVLSPCLVTLLTIGRESSPAAALRLAGRQAFFAVAFSILLGWGAEWLL